LTDKLSVGFGLNLDVADVQADPLLFAPPNVVLGIPTYGSGTGTRFAWGGGFDVGAYYITDYSWRLGVSYKSKQWFEPLRFNSNDLLGDPIVDKVRFDLPSITSIGAAYDGWNRIVYAIDIRWYDNSDAAGFGSQGFRPDGSVRGLGWRDIISINNGIQYCVNDCLKLRLGYQYIENPVPSAQEEFNVGTPLIMNHFLSVGASYTIRDGILAHISYTHGFRNSVTGPYVTPLGPIPNTSITSTTSADQIIVGLTVLF
jgi:long-chain fatty acid transport protein